MTLQQLAELAQSLELTDMQRRFAEAYVLEPSGNASEAARIAGTSAEFEGQQAYKWLNSVKVQKYIEAYRETAITSLPKSVAVVDLARAIQILSEQAEGKRPTKIKKAMVQHRDGDSVEWLPSKERTYEPMRAAEILTNIYKPTEKAQDHSRSLTINLLGKAEPRVLVDALNGLLDAGDE